MGIINKLYNLTLSKDREETYNHAPKAVAYQMRTDREQRDKERARREYEKVRASEKRYFEEKKKRDEERRNKTYDRAARRARMERKIKRGVHKIENSKGAKMIDTLTKQGAKDIKNLRNGKVSIKGGKIPARAEKPKVFMDMGGVGIFDGLHETRQDSGFNSLDYLGMDAFRKETPKKNRKQNNEYDDYMRNIIF